MNPGDPEQDWRKDRHPQKVETAKVGDYKLKGLSGYFLPDPIFLLELKTPFLTVGIKKARHGFYLNPVVDVVDPDLVTLR